MPLGRKKGKPGTFLGHHEQAQLLAQLSVVPALGLLDLGQVLVQLLLLGEGDTVDPLEGLAVGVPPPVGGVAGGELDAVALDPPGGVQVGAGAQVGELPLLVEGDGGVLRQVVDELHLVGLLPLLHELHRLGRGSSNRSSFSFSLQIFRISASSSASWVSEKGSGVSKS